MSGVSYRVYGKNSFQPENITLDGKSEQDHARIVLDKLNERMKKYPCIIFKEATNGIDTIELEREIKNFNPDLLFDTHTDAGGGQGTTVFTNSLGSTFAMNLYNEISPLSPGADRGIKTTNELRILRQLRGNGELIPACLVELLFHDNQADFDYYMTHYDDLARALEKAIVKTLNIDYVEDFMLVIVAFDVPDVDSARRLATAYHVPCIPKQDILEKENYIQVGGSDTVRKDRQCLGIIAGADREETDTKVTEIIKRGKLI